MTVAKKEKTKKSLEEMIVSVEEIETEVEEQIPEIGDDNWEEYIMSQFKEEELFEGKHPTLNGLRRVCSKFLYKVVKSKVVRLERNWDEKGSAFCVYELEFENGSVYHGAGDATPRNTMEAYSVYPVAMAENRAEARAYRKALMLKSAAAEEISEAAQFTSVLSSDYNENDPMSAQQEVIIKTKCKQQNITYDDFMSENCKGKPTREEAARLINKLNDLQHGR